MQRDPRQFRLRTPAAATANWLINGLLLLGLVVPAAGFAQTDQAEDKPAVAPLFADDSQLDVTIEAPLTTLRVERPDEEYLDGRFSFTAADGTEKTFDLKIRTRGSYRRDKRHCDFAPIRLNFRKKQVVGTEFDGQDKLKMVTHCQDNSPRYEQLVLREYLVYRILNTLTVNSFGVRLFRVRYIDTEGGEPMKTIGFVIENIDDVARRNAMQAVSTGNVPKEELDREQENLINVFEYMVGNTEYSLSTSEPDKDCCHNSDLMSVSGGPPFTSLAYDFDFAGIVNAPYAEPNPKYDIHSVRQRLYKGRCSNNDLLPQTLQRFLDQKDAIYAIVKNLDQLERKGKRSVRNYMDSFYKTISSPRLVELRLISRCNSP